MQFDRRRRLAPPADIPSEPALGKPFHSLRKGIDNHTGHDRMVLQTRHVYMLALLTWCQLCKEYQVGGFAAPVPCTNILNDVGEIMRNRSMEIIRDLHPAALDSFRRLTQYLESSYEDGRTASLFVPFEGLRTPRKQQELFGQRPPVTHVGPWHSAHQYGLAVDFVPLGTNGQYTWRETEEWHFLRSAAALHGLRNPFDWDRAHVEHPLWLEIHALLREEVTQRVVANDNLKK